MSNYRFSSWFSFFRRIFIVLPAFLFYDISAKTIYTKGGYMNTITELLNLEDSDIIISDITIQGTTKILTLETKPHPRYCPVCGFKMHSRGTKQRTIVSVKYVSV